ncbi:CGNR zinc finger domain-containing protein [Sinomonas sp. ASV322]|uniref:CGNR zinc finger domain-containing protein n=1 Tax=Sinomonas sp. ASV322 TaxID=3041920 RepID=UPI0027DB034F|nr:CGNR zinc finger domain-containing protein [Sinomonas sp. ASV322]MDQ4502992.1 CGNR zinc finger domain-containing protein [Sinomonas sp. ASV322]
MARRNSVPDPAVSALMELLATSPSFLEIGGIAFDGLNHVNQLRALSERAGLAVPRELSVEEIFALRGKEPLDALSLDDPGWCPSPGISDVAAVRRLRETLRDALFASGAPSEKMAARRLTSAARGYLLTPALTDRGDLMVQTSQSDFSSRLAARLVPAAMRLVADGQMHRLGRCAEPWCRSPFVDRSRNGSAAYCGARCASRARMRRHRDAA